VIHPRVALRRRELLVVAAGALVARPAAALAADDPAVLLRLVAREDAAALAYRRAAPEPLPGLAAQEADHAAALRTLLDGYGVLEIPRPALDAPAQRLVDAPDAGRVVAAIALESSLMAEYSAALLTLEAAGSLQTAASILASHAQHHARLRSRAGLDPFG
jgi:Ferritin-like domain